MNTTAPQELDDEELVARSRAGEVEALQEISGRYYPVISALAYQGTGSLSQGDNITRE